MKVHHRDAGHEGHKTALAGCSTDLSAPSLAGVFEAAARALAEATVDPATVPESIAQHIVLVAPTPGHLLFDWLSELIYLRDRDGEVYVRTSVQVTGAGPYRLAARLHGGRIVPGRTVQRADVRGVAVHPFTLEPGDGGWHARFFLDF
jgi:SHS2 domain-containing protein